jgi:hypothetical protein
MLNTFRKRKVINLEVSNLQENTRRNFLMIYVNATIYYHGTKPTEEYIRQLQTDFEYRFVTLKMREIKGTTFGYTSYYISRIICPGNPELTLNDRLRCSYLDTNLCVKFKWDIRLWSGIHTVHCPKGNYQILTYTPSCWLAWLFHKIFKS